MTNFDNLGRYRAFLAVSEYGSISRAADMLYISQPAVSASIKKLEESMNTALFIRKPRGVALTDSGRILYDGITKAMAMISGSEERVRSLSGASRLRIAASNVLCKHMLMPYLKRFTEKYPNADVSITCTSSAQATALLEGGKVDIALAAKPAYIHGLAYHALGDIEYIFVCTPLYIEKLGCGGSDIFEHGNIMLLNKSNVSRTHIDDYYTENKINPAHILEVNDMDLLIEFAKMGIGVSCVVKQFVQSELENGMLTEITLPTPVPPRETGFLYHDDIHQPNKNIFRLIELV